MCGLRTRSVISRTSNQKLIFRFRYFRVHGERGFQGLLDLALVAARHRRCRVCLSPITRCVMPSSREAKKGQNELNNDKRRLYRTLNRRTALHGRWVPGIVREPNGITVHLMEDGNATLVHPDGTTLHLTTATGDAVRITPDGVSRRSLIRDSRPPQALGPAAVAVASMARSLPVVIPPPAPAQPAPPLVALAHPPPNPLEIGHGAPPVLAPSALAPSALAPSVLAPAALALPEVPLPPPPRMAVPAVLAFAAVATAGGSTASGPSVGGPDAASIAEGAASASTSAPGAWIAIKEGSAAVATGAGTGNLGAGVACARMAQPSSASTTDIAGGAVIPVPPCGGAALQLLIDMAARQPALDQ